MIGHGSLLHLSKAGHLNRAYALVRERHKSCLPTYEYVAIQVDIGICFHFHAAIWTDPAQVTPTNVWIRWRHWAEGSKRDSSIIWTYAERKVSFHFKSLQWQLVAASAMFDINIWFGRNGAEHTLERHKYFGCCQRTSQHSYRWWRIPHPLRWYSVVSLAHRNSVPQILYWATAAWQGSVQEHVKDLRRAVKWVQAWHNMTHASGGDWRRQRKRNGVKILSGMEFTHTSICSMANIFEFIS